MNPQLELDDCEMQQCSSNFCTIMPALLVCVIQSLQPRLPVAALHWHVHLPCMQLV